MSVLQADKQIFKQDILNNKIKIKPIFSDTPFTDHRFPNKIAKLTLFNAQMCQFLLCFSVGQKTMDGAVDCSEQRFCYHNSKMIKSLI